MPNGPSGERFGEALNVQHIAGYTLAVVVSATGGYFGGTAFDKPVQENATRLTRSEFIAWTTANNERLTRNEKALDSSVQHRELDALIRRLDRIETLLDKLVARTPSQERP